MKFNSRKSVLKLSVGILSFIFIGIFCINFFQGHNGIKLSLVAASIFTVPLALISIPSGLLMMSSGDATQAFENKDKDSDDRKILENRICPFYSHKIE